MLFNKGTAVRDDRASGFSLTELLIVLLAISILAALVVPKFTNAAERSRITAVATNMRFIADAAKRYHLKHGEWPADVNRGKWPSDFQEYLHEFDLAQTPVGGKWDWDNWEGRSRRGVAIAVSILEIGDATMAKIDAEMDDGDLNSGSVRKNGDRLQLVLETD